MPPSSVSTATAWTGTAGAHDGFITGGDGGVFEVALRAWSISELTVDAWLAPADAERYPYLVAEDSGFIVAG